MTAITAAAENPAERLARLPRPLLWVIAARLKTLSLSQVPVLAGTWLAALAGGWHWGVTLTAMIAAGAIQIGTNLWNDAADAARGVDGPDRLGPPRLTALGLLDGRRVRAAAAGAFGLAALAGLYLAVLGGWPIILTGVLSLGFGYFYSMGPWPMSGQPFGEALVIAFFGVVAVAGTVHLHGGGLSSHIVLTGLMIGLPAAAVLLLNNHRDRMTDARAGRRTLAILIGRNGTRGLYAGFLMLALALAVWQGPCLTLAPAAALAVWLAAAIARTPVTAALNRLLPLTALYQIVLLLGVVGAPVICG